MGYETERKRLRRARVIAWQNGEVSPQFCRGAALYLPWPEQRQRADESLAVENLRRAYYTWKTKKRTAR